MKTVYYCMIVWMTLLPLPRGKYSMEISFAGYATYSTHVNVSYNLRWGQKSNVHQAGSSSDSGRFGTE